MSDGKIPGIDYQNLLELFVQNTPNAVAMLNNNLEYMLASDAWYSNYNIEGKDIIGMHHYDVFPEIREMPHWQEDHKKALAGKVIRSEKDRFERADGGINWLRYVIQPWRHGNGEIGGIIMFTEDITERIELENKLIRSESEFRTIFETIDEGIVYQNKDGAITNANAAAERILGLSLDQMTGRKSIDPRWKALREDGSDFPGDEHPAMIALKTGKEQRNIIQGIFHPGKEDYIWITVNSYPILDEETGEVLQVYSTFEDITDEYNAKKALIESEKRFNLAVQGTTAGLWDWISVKEDRQWWSPKFNELLGYEPNELEPKVETFSKLVHPDDEEMAFKLLDRHFKKKAAFIVEYRLKTKSGKYRWFLGSGQATWDDDGEPQRMVGTIVDIHARKMAELAEIEYSQELSRKNKELEEFTYVASHDLQEPVRTIASFVELFRELYQGRLDDQANEFLDLMEGASKRSQQLISDLLQYSRIGRQGELSEVDMSEMVSEILEDLSAMIKESKAEINVHDLPQVSGYRTDLRLLIQNLISNAIKFAKKDEAPKVELSVKVHEENFEFIVSDNGIGIDKKFFDQIFVVFKRLHGRSEYAGTGIGLAHCKKVVDLHDGEIWVESKVGKGTQFHFTIPKDTEPDEL